METASPGNARGVLVNQCQENLRLLGSLASQGENNGATGNNAEIPLPSDLKRILNEVAGSGACSWLSWDNDAKDLLFDSVGGPGRPSKSSPTALVLGSQGYSTRPGTSSSSVCPSIAQAPPRKKHRNDFHKSSRPLCAKPDEESSSAANRESRLILTRTHPNTTTNASAFCDLRAVGTGKTSGSEPDDATQYECDSEGTSTSSNSEVFDERQRGNQQGLKLDPLKTAPPTVLSVSHTGTKEVLKQPNSTLQEAFRNAVGIVLDHFYRNRGGYKLSPAEKRRKKTLTTCRVESDRDLSITAPPLTPEDIFIQRRQQLVDMLRPRHSMEINGSMHHEILEGPPFTIQRIAEVLIAPERYYTQTHKLCNCLEKLLLVTSSTGAFGGSTGGDTSQSRREVSTEMGWTTDYIEWTDISLTNRLAPKEREMTALVYERSRQESELRQRRMRRRPISPSDDVAVDSEGNGSPCSRDDSIVVRSKSAFSTELKLDEVEGQCLRGVSTDSDSREMFEAVARASLRTKFDHVGIDPHDSLDRALTINRGMANSPPPPNLTLAGGLPSHGVSGFVRPHVQDQTIDHPLIARAPSPILFPSSEHIGGHSGNGGHSGTDLQPSPNIHMLQLHDVVALSGVSLERCPPAPLDLDVSAEGADMEVDHGRSSASNSDVDSEQSDDISLDDSTSDRSDGSDSGSGQHYEPFTAARAMALNRMQQQQRLQSRVLASLNEGFRPPTDSEYQSGDSIDSMRAEDSGGSDSSSQSSDIAD